MFGPIDAGLYQVVILLGDIVGRFSAAQLSFALTHRHVRSIPHITVDHEHRQWEARVFLFSGVSIQSHLQFRTAALRIYCSRY